MMVLRLEALMPPAELAKKHAREAAHDRAAKRIFDDIMVDGGNSI